MKIIMIESNNDGVTKAKLFKYKNSEDLFKQLKKELKTAIKEKLDSDEYDFLKQEKEEQISFKTFNQNHLSKLLSESDLPDLALCRGYLFYTKDGDRKSITELL